MPTQQMNQMINPEDFVIKIIENVAEFKQVKVDTVFCSDFIRVLGKIMKLE